MLPNVLQISKMLVGAVVAPGDVVVDATVGHGRDTRFLAEMVGDEGHVYGFDVMPEAIGRAHALLAEAGIAARATLVEADHAEMDAHLPGDVRLAAAMFNLGYLPGSDRAVRTRATSTIPALRTALARLRAGGRLSVVVYRRHDDGTEADAVAAWTQSLPAREAHVVRYGMTNRKAAPALYVVERTGGPSG